MSLLSGNHRLKSKLYFFEKVDTFFSGRLLLESKLSKTFPVWRELFLLTFVHNYQHCHVWGENISFGTYPSFIFVFNCTFIIPCFVACKNLLFLWTSMKPLSNGFYFMCQQQLFIFMSFSGVWQQSFDSCTETFFSSLHLEFFGTSCIMKSFCFVFFLYIYTECYHTTENEFKTG